MVELGNLLGTEELSPVEMNEVVWNFGYHTSVSQAILFTWR